MKNRYQLHSIKINHAANQRGASLLEGIAYLGIAAIIILGAVSLLTSAFSSAQTNRAENEVVSIRTGVKKLYQGQSATYGTTSLNANLIAAQVFPTTLSQNAGTGVVTNAWNGTVTVTGATSLFTITYTAVPQDVCINMVSGGAGWVSVDVNGANAQTTFPVPPANAVTACDVSTTAGNTIKWTAS